MYSPITVVKVRKQTKVTVPAGGWVLIGHPEQPLADQIARRAELIKDGHVNDDFEQLLIGRITDTHPVVRFATAEQFAAQEKQRKENEKNLSASHDDARARQKKMEQDTAKAAAVIHRETVAKLNQNHDALRNRSTAPAEAQTGVQLETDENKNPDGSNEFSAEELAKKNRGELLTLAADLVAAKRLDELPAGSKSDIITAILTARPVVVANV